LIHWEDHLFKVEREEDPKPSLVGLHILLCAYCKFLYNIAKRWGGCAIWQIVVFQTDYGKIELYKISYDVISVTSSVQDFSVLLLPTIVQLYSGIFIGLAFVFKFNTQKLYI